MNERRHYLNAPIVEALIDLRVTLPDDITIDRLSELATSLQDRYPIRQDFREFSGKFEIQPHGEIQTDAEQQHTGFRLSNVEASKQVVIARLSGLTVSLLPPYTTWEDLCDTAREVWNAYKAACRPINVTRIAVRYINRLDLPDTLSQVTEYLQVFPTLSAKFPGYQPSDYFMQLIVPQDDMDSVLIVNSGRVPPPSEKPEVLSLILDFDLFRDVTAQPWEVEDDAPIWDFLERLHTRKNEAFEASITDKVRELIR